MNVSKVRIRLKVRTFSLDIVFFGTKLLLSWLVSKTGNGPIPNNHALPGYVAHAMGFIPRGLGV